MRRRRRWPGITRDTVLFAGGAFLLTWEVIVNKDGAEPALMILLGAMMGLPAVFRVVERRQQEKDDPPPSSTSPG